MKIGVLTHPLHGNYGGLLQSYAVVTTLCKLGHEAYNLEYMPKNYLKRISSKAKCFKESVRIFLMRCGLRCFDFPTPSRLSVNVGETFQRKHVPSLSIESETGPSVERLGLDSIVVGSDQVWRGAYARQMKTLPFYFLDFVPSELRRKSISYAPSFGTDEWEGDEEETAICGALLRDYKSVSVREESGIEICRSQFKVEAEQVPDPTLLLEPKDYERIIDAEDTWIPERDFLCSYVLDNSPSMLRFLNSLASQTGLYLQPLKSRTVAKLPRDRYPVSVAQWLRGIKDCKYLVTDSFHGCVFAIIFNKPFVCLGNQKRGTARFETLLSTYGLQNRLVCAPTTEIVHDILSTPIDWNKVNTARAAEKERGLAFMKKTY